MRHNQRESNPGSNDFEWIFSAFELPQKISCDVYEIRRTYDPSRKKQFAVFFYCNCPLYIKVDITPTRIALLMLLSLPGK